jgi:hypothetical protein
MVEQLTYWDYLKEAFNRRKRVPLLGMMPFNWMALGVIAVAGLINPGIWLLGLAAELVYLFGVSGSERFQKLVKGERMLNHQRAWATKVHTGVERLTMPSRERYRRLLEQCRLILGISETLDEHSLGNFRDMRAQSLNQLLGIFLRLLTSREVIIANVSDLDRSRLEGEIAKLEERLTAAQADSALMRSLQGTLDIQRKRLENLARADESLQVVEAELDRIEQQVELIREESAVTGKPEALSIRLDAVTTAMSETTRWMDDHADFFGSLAPASDSTLPELPELPQLSDSQ